MSSTRPRARPSRREIDRPTEPRMKRLLLAPALAVLFTFPVHAACKSAHPESLIRSLLRQAPGLKAEVLTLALDATACAAEKGLVQRRELLTVIDYSIPSTQPRLWVFNVAEKKLLFRELVAHGKNSGGNRPNFFS